MYDKLMLIILMNSLTFAPAFASPDEFDRFDGEELIAATKREKGEGIERLTLAELGALPNVLKEARAALVVVKTDQGNVGRLLLSSAFRKNPKGTSEPVPVLVLERFDTFEAPRAKVRLAGGRDLLLFDGFEVDLDAGLIVPPGQGGDLKFLAGGPDGSILRAIGSARIHPLKSAPDLKKREPGKPSPGKTIEFEDYSGRYRLIADGKAAGTLELKVNGQGAVSGRFRSDETGGVYDLKGEVGSSRSIRFRISYPRVSQSFEGWLWREGKNAFAGSARMLDRSASFIAVREGASIEPPKP